MNKSKTIETIELYNSIIEANDYSDEAYEFLHCFELELAKAMLNEFDEKTNIKIARVLLSILN